MTEPARSILEVEGHPFALSAFPERDDPRYDGTIWWVPALESEPAG